MMKNIKLNYARIRVPAIPGVYPYERDFIVYARTLKGPNIGKVCADRKFKTHEAAQMYFNALTTEQRE